MGRVEQKTTERLMAANNTLMVGPGMKYTSIQAAVDAAEAATPGPSNQFLIQVAEGVALDYEFTTVANAEYIHVVPMGITGQRSGNLREFAGERPVVRYKTRGPALLCLRLDDGADTCAYANWIAELGTSPSQYARNNGVTVDCAINTAYLNGDLTDENKLTAAEIHALYRDCGWNFHSHAHLHDTEPTTDALVRQQVVQSAAILRGLMNGASHIGLPARGFTQPGNWTTHALDDLDHMEGHIGNLLRMHYDYSMGEFGNDYAGTGGISIPAHRQARTSFAAVSKGRTDAEIDNILRQAATPGNRTIIYFHDILGDAAATADERTYVLKASQFKRIVDAVSKLSGGYADKIQTVSADAIFLADFDTTVGSMGGVPGGSFDDHTTATLDVAGDAGWLRGFYLQQQAGDAWTIETVSGTDLCLQLLRTSASGTTRVAFSGGACRPGINFLKFGFKAHAEGALNAVLTIKFYGPPYTSGVGTVTADATALTLTPTGDWVTRYIPFGMPSWATDVRFYFVAANGDGSNKGFLLNDVECFPV